MYNRVQKHFEIFKLGRLYSIKASELIFGIETMLKRLYARAGEDAVRFQIEEEMRSRETISLNSWQSAFYRGIYNSEWFYTDWIR
jgi:tagatose-1,6-bisphosphate aldolase non-catalytic subunit AgaZ/GatZ